MGPLLAKKKSDKETKGFDEKKALKNIEIVTKTENFDTNSKLERQPLRLSGPPTKLSDPEPVLGPVMALHTDAVSKILKERGHEVTRGSQFGSFKHFRRTGDGYGNLNNQEIADVVGSHVKVLAKINNLVVAETFIEFWWSSLIPGPELKKVIEKSVAKLQTIEKKPDDKSDDSLLYTTMAIAMMATVSTDHDDGHKRHGHHDCSTNNNHNDHHTSHHTSSYDNHHTSSHDYSHNSHDFVHHDFSSHDHGGW
jgi:hypothetical protein